MKIILSVFMVAALITVIFIGCSTSTTSPTPPDTSYEPTPWEMYYDSGPGSWDEIKDVFVLVMEFWAASSSSQLRDRFKENFRIMYQEFRGIVESLVHEGIERGEFRADINPESVAAALVGAWDALFLQAWFDQDFDPLTTAKDFLAVVVQGLSNR